MRPLRKLCVLAVVAMATLTAARTARSEPGGLHLNITPFGGYADWAKDVNLDDRPMFGGRVGLGFGRYIGVEGYYSWLNTHTHYGTGDSLFVGSPTSLSPHSDQSIRGYGADLTLNLFPSIAFDPYVLGGWHEEKIKADLASTEIFQNGLEVGGGVKLGLGHKAALRLELRDKFWKFPSPPVPNPPGDKSISNLFYSGGIQISLGGSSHPKDSDKDGVSDKDDKCPNTPLGAVVDASGCPIDTDGDGVPDGIDQCANTPHGTAVDARGCPLDSDNDGVTDDKDKCPNTPAGAKVDDVGCPIDSDGDGVPDGIDQCPGTPPHTQVDARGCAIDSDGDGVTDDKDKCPNTPPNVKVDSDGCPIELSEKETELLDKGRITTREIHFATAKWDILPESAPVIDDIGKVLIQWPQLRIEIGGHADARGSDAYNMDLTQKRAQAVLDYLLAHFPQINKEQYAAKGYGKRKPVASNKTVEGMAKNRRVEFKVLNTEELTKERERRRLLHKGE